MEKPLQRVPKGSILGVLIELIAHEPQFPEDSVRMLTVAVAEEVSSFIIEFTPLLGGRILQDEALFAETPSVGNVRYWFSI
jgi:hypothetical protein